MKPASCWANAFSQDWWQVNDNKWDDGDDNDDDDSDTNNDYNNSDGDHYCLINEIDEEFYWAVKKNESILFEYYLN